MKIFKREIPFENACVRINKSWDIFKRCALMLLAPIPFGGITALIWYKYFYIKGISMDGEMEGIVTTAWIGSIIIIYAFFVNGAYEKVQTELQAMHEAVKKHDFDKFVDLRDEDVSPLTHMLMFATSMVLLAAFFSLKYSSHMYGVLVIGSVAYLLALILFIIMEVDNPCAGLWYIKSIPDEWLKVDVKEYRKFRNQKAAEESAKKISEYNESKRKRGELLTPMT